jgi:hypothetical protein
MKSTRYIDGGTNLNGNLKVMFWSLKQLIVKWINQLYVRCLYRWILVVQQWVFKTHGRLPRREWITRMTIGYLHVEEVGGSNNINDKIKRLTWSKHFPSIFGMPTCSCCYKKTWFFLPRTLVKKNPPYGFFVPMSNLTKMPFWISYFGPDNFDWVFLVGFSIVFFLLSHHDNDYIYIYNFN